MVSMVVSYILGNTILVKLELWESVMVIIILVCH